MNVTIQDGMTNGAGNIVKKLSLHQWEKPFGIIWVQFDHADVGEKTHQNNKNLYTQVIKPEWTPIKPITIQFAVARDRTAQAVRNSFLYAHQLLECNVCHLSLYHLPPNNALRSQVPQATHWQSVNRTIHRSQGDTEKNVFANFDAKQGLGLT